MIKLKKDNWHNGLNMSYSLILSREGLILTLSILPCLEGWIFWSIPRDRIDDEENVRTPSNLRRYWEIHPLRPRKFHVTLEISGLGKSLGRRGWISQYFPRFGGARIILCIRTFTLSPFSSYLRYKWQLCSWQQRTLVPKQNRPLRCPIPSSYTLHLTHTFPHLFWSHKYCIYEVTVLEMKGYNSSNRQSTH